MAGYGLCFNTHANHPGVNLLEFHLHSVNGCQVPPQCGYPLNIPVFPVALSWAPLLIASWSSVHLSEKNFLWAFF